jgi:pimeloyl-ACP methyl ester carboxylesterase
MTAELSEQVVPVWNDTIKLRVQVGGQGPALVYLHGAGGLVWDPFVARLAETHTVYAPEFPGTSAGDPMAIDVLDGLWDVVLVYEEALRSLGLVGRPVIRRSFGGMLAAELAATLPSLFSHAVLLDPVGLWRDEVGVANWIAAAPSELPARLFADPTGPAAQAMFTPPDDPAAAVDGVAALVWAIGCTGKFLWPIPDRGLARRLHRIAARTLVVWGEQDNLISSIYAKDFGAAIADTGTAVHAFAALGYALYHRERTGRGQHIDIAMVDCMFHMHEGHMECAHFSDYEPKRTGRHHELVFPVGTFKGPQGWIVVLALDLQWPNFCRAIDRPDLIDDPRYKQMTDRAQRRHELIAMTEAWMATFATDAAVIAQLEAHRVPCSPVLSPLDAIGHEYYESRDMVRWVEDPLVGPVPIPGYPFKFGDQPNLPDLVAPILGQHNAEILSDRLGLLADRIAELTAAGVLRQGTT